MESGVIINLISQPCAPINQVEPCATNTLLSETNPLACPALVLVRVQSNAIRVSHLWHRNYREKGIQ